MKNAGIQVDTPEVLLSHQGLLEVCSFERLKCMEALWLNHNLLTKIEGLDTNLQLKALYLHNNRINTLKGSLKYLKHIEMLALQNNRLTDLEATLKLMEHLTRLEELDMSGNALANELNYRPRVIYRFPRLKVLDRHGSRHPRMQSGGVWALPVSPWLPCRLRLFARMHCRCVCLQI